jgi:hypothetical protein
MQQTQSRRRIGMDQESAASLPLFLRMSPRGHCLSTSPMSSGGKQVAQSTAQVFNRLAAGDQANTAIFANNYGEAAAIDFFGPRYGLPPSISKAETYWLWGPRQYDGNRYTVVH